MLYTLWPHMNICYLKLCSLNVIYVDGTNVSTEDTIMIRCGSEIIPGHVSEGILYNIMLIRETFYLFF